MKAATAFGKAREERRAALVAYLPFGFPHVDGSIDALRAVAESGADVIEIGLPYSDPVMDGPTIQAASQTALENGVRTRDVFRAVEAVAATGVPVLVMTYWNLVEHYGSTSSDDAPIHTGVEVFARDLANAGGAGLITPDLLPEEASDWITASDEHDLDRVFLVAPSSTDARLALTTEACRGFVYATAVMGVTGAREETSNVAPALVARTREFTDLPIGVGLGVSNAEQAAAVARYADGVIVGSALVRCLLDAPTPQAGIAAVGALTTDLAAGVRRGTTYFTGT